LGTIGFPRPSWPIKVLIFPGLLGWSSHYSGYFGRIGPQGHWNPKLGNNQFIPFTYFKGQILVSQFTTQRAEFNLGFKVNSFLSPIPFPTRFFGFNPFITSLQISNQISFPKVKETPLFFLPSRVSFLPFLKGKGYPIKLLLNQKILHSFPTQNFWAKQPPFQGQISPIPRGIFSRRRESHSFFGIGFPFGD